MREIEQWLIRIGLDQYGPLFVEQAIDLSVLPALRNDDLKELGIPLGHRKRFLRAISELWWPPRHCSTSFDLPSDAGAGGARRPTRTRAG